MLAGALELITKLLHAITTKMRPRFLEFADPLSAGNCCFLSELSMNDVCDEKKVFSYSNWSFTLLLSNTVM